MTEVRVPDIGDFTDVPVVEVLVAPGDTVQTDEPVVILESDKASMEVPAPRAGVVGEVTISVGDTVSEGDVILTLEAGDGDEPEPEPEPEDDDADGEDEGDGEAGAGEPARETPAPSGAAAARSSRNGDAADGEVFAGPGARRVARELGVELAGVAGTGHKGRVTTEDVRAAASRPAPAAPAGEGLPPWPQVDFARFGPVETVELPRIKRISGPVLARNWLAIPHVTQHDETDVTDLEAFRKDVNAAHAEEGVKVTMVALLLKASAAALRIHPELNSSLEGDRLVLKRYYHLGVAVDTPEGLVVPVIRDVDRKGLLELARELTEVSGRARAGRLTREDIEGGTFSISSLGGIGGTAFTPIINAPEVAILGVSRMATKPVWRDGEWVPRLILPLSLSYDHRVVDGALAARFTTLLGSLLSDPRKMLL
jgi:pyruvate dehydrogenase E2 component (dihydrolipoamide acetyltransferase)